MTQYFERDFPNAGPIFYAFARDTPGIPDFTEWRLEDLDWVEILDSRLLGWMIKGELSLDSIEPDEVPVLLSADPIAGPSTRFR